MTTVASSSCSSSSSSDSSDSDDDFCYAPLSDMSDESMGSGSDTHPITQKQRARLRELLQIRRNVRMPMFSMHNEELSQLRQLRREGKQRRKMRILREQQEQKELQHRQSVKAELEQDECVESKVPEQPQERPPIGHGAISSLLSLQTLQRQISEHSEMEQRVLAGRVLPTEVQAFLDASRQELSAVGDLHLSSSASAAAAAPGSASASVAAEEEAAASVHDHPPSAKPKARRPKGQKRSIAEAVAAAPELLPTGIADCASAFAVRMATRLPQYLKQLPTEPVGYAQPIQPGELFRFDGRLHRVQDIVHRDQWVPVTNKNVKSPDWANMDPRAMRPDFVAVVVTEDGKPLGKRDTINRMSFVSDITRNYMWAVSIAGGKAIIKTYPRMTYNSRGERVVNRALDDLKSKRTGPFTFNDDYLIEGQPICKAVIPVRYYNDLLKITNAVDIYDIEGEEEEEEEEGGEAQNEAGEGGKADGEIADTANESTTQRSRVLGIRTPAAGTASVQPSEPAAKRSRASNSDHTPAVSRSRKNNASAKTPAATATAASSASVRAYVLPPHCPSMHKDAVQFVEERLLPQLRERVKSRGSGDVSVMFASWLSGTLETVNAERGLLNLAHRFSQQCTEHMRFSKSQNKLVPSKQFLMSKQAMVEFGARVHLFSTPQGHAYLMEVQQRLTDESVAQEDCPIV